MHYNSMRKSGQLEKIVHIKSHVCGCGKKAIKMTGVCRSCGMDNREEKNRAKGRCCTVEGCGSFRIYSKGMCQKHSQQVKRKGKALTYGRYELNEIVLTADTACILCRDTAGHVVASAWVDPDLVPELCKHKWHFDKSTGYAATKDGQGKKLYLHRAVATLLGFPEEQLIDHSDGNRLLNIGSNLRETDLFKNASNSRQGLGSKYSVPDHKGVYICAKSGSYVANITYKGKTIAKPFKTLQQAVDYRKALVDRYQGEHAYENRAGAAET